jgi:ornithine carbamoyltransferase
MDLHGRSLLAVTDLSAEEFTYLVELARDLRTEKRLARGLRQLEGQNIGLICEMTSAGDVAAFEAAAHDEGAQVSYLGPCETQLGHKKSIKDTARVLGRIFDGIEYRGPAQDTVETLAAYAGVPVWNGLTDTWHPIQMLADILTVTDHCAKPLGEVSLCYLGDGRSSTANSLLVTGGLLGMDVRVCAPPALRPAQAVQLAAGRLAPRSGARLTVTSDVRSAVAGADFLYTDTWLPFGEPGHDWENEPGHDREKTIDQLLPYQVNPHVLAATGNSDVKFMHCLPTRHTGRTGVSQRRGHRQVADLEVVDEVFESAASVVLDQAENRVHTSKALMVATLGRKA